MTAEMNKTGGGFWILIIVGLKSSFLALSSLNDVQPDDQILLRGLALISAISAFTAARLLWVSDPRVKLIAIIPFVALVGLFIALSFVGGEGVTPGMAIMGCSVVLFVGTIALVKIHYRFAETNNDVSQ